jgi:TolA-binding protein
MNRNRCPGVLLILILLFLGDPRISAGSETIIRSDEQLRLAQEAMERGEYQRAIVELERFLHFFPEEEKAPNARYLIGLSYLKAKQYENARNVFDAIIQAYPGTPVSGQALFMIAESFYMQGLFEDAERIFTRIVAEHPDSELGNRAVYRLGWTLMHRNRWKEASQAFHHVDQASPLFQNAGDLSRKSLMGENLPSKNPVTAGVLAAALPGLGHAYTNRYKDGMVAFLLNGLFIWAAYESFQEDHHVLGSILIFLELGWYSGNIYSAVNSAHKYNKAVKNDFLRSLRDRLDVGMFTTREGHVGLSLHVNF